ncbi:QueT transporter family protein [Aciduricibacillus chroicocephali]|uniref:QueT transporter family protein n=1 Tax=Aciduricibacillus chroicocephali TaxID=3054939 RepID=A0ABY9KW42_9BACI|nr:QueT transporter family protein [Bacillaceae bacterium 44XB]
MNTRTLVANGLLAALYIAVSFMIQPLAYGPVQLRIPEMLNLLIVYNNKYFYGIVIGVFITNLFSPNGVLDLFFGVGQSIIALALTMLIGLFIKNKLQLMTVNTLIFTATMVIIAWEIVLVNMHNVANDAFMPLWGILAAGEFIVMAIGIPIMYALDKRLHFKDLI